MKANRELKRRIKAYLRRHECSITALDLPRKFVRHMTVDDAIEFLEQMELGKVILCRAALLKLPKWLLIEAEINGW